MEIFLNGPGGCMSTWDLTKSSYDWWKDKSKKFIFDYVWNFNSQGFNNDNMFHREMLDVPLKVSFLSKAPCINPTLFLKLLDKKLYLFTAAE